MEHLRRYQLLRELGAGVRGNVFLARSTSGEGVSRLVAVRVLPLVWSDSIPIADALRERLRRLGWLRHRGIAGVDDVVGLAGRVAVVSQFADGVGLAELIGSRRAARSPVPPRVALELVAHVASALDAMWTRVPYEGGEAVGIAHGDVRPATIRVDDAGSVRLVDIGVALALGDRAGRRKGGRPVANLSPERSGGLAVAPEADVYGLGGTLIELLTLRPLDRPRVRADAHARALAARVGPLRALDGIEGDIASGIATLVEEMCVHQASSRPTAAEVVTRARSLARRIPDEGLVEWAERVVTPLVETRVSPAVNPLAETVLIEERREPGRPGLDIAVNGVVQELPRSGDHDETTEFTATTESLRPRLVEALDSGDRTDAMDAPPGGGPRTLRAVPLVVPAPVVLARGPFDDRTETMDAPPGMVPLVLPAPLDPAMSIAAPSAWDDSPTHLDPGRVPLVEAVRAEFELTDGMIEPTGGVPSPFLAIALDALPTTLERRPALAAPSVANPVEPVSLVPTLVPLADNAGDPTSSDPGRPESGEQKRPDGDLFAERTETMELTASAREALGPLGEDTVIRDTAPPVQAPASAVPPRDPSPSESDTALRYESGRVVPVARVRAPPAGDRPTIPPIVRAPAPPRPKKAKSTGPDLVHVLLAAASGALLAVLVLLVHILRSGPFG